MQDLAFCKLRVSRTLRGVICDGSTGEIDYLVGTMSNEQIEIVEKEVKRFLLIRRKVSWTDDKKGKIKLVNLMQSVLARARQKFLRRGKIPLQKKKKVQEEEEEEEEAEDGSRKHKIDMACRQCSTRKVVAGTPATSDFASGEKTNAGCNNEKSMHDANVELHHSQTENCQQVSKNTCQKEDVSDSLEIKYVNPIQITHEMQNLVDMHGHYGHRSFKDCTCMKMTASTTQTLRSPTLQNSTYLVSAKI